MWCQIDANGYMIKGPSILPRPGYDTEFPNNKWDGGPKYKWRYQAGKWSKDNANHLQKMRDRKLTAYEDALRKKIISEDLTSLKQDYANKKSALDAAQTEAAIKAIPI